MSKPLSITLLIIGVVLLLYGLDSSASFAASVSKFFTGAPTHTSTALLAVGAALAVSGCLSLFKGGTAR